MQRLILSCPVLTACHYTMCPYKEKLLDQENCIGLQGGANAAASDAMPMDTWTSSTSAAPAPPSRHTPDRDLDELLDAEDAWTMTRFPVHQSALSSLS